MLANNEVGHGESRGKALIVQIEANSKGKYLANDLLTNQLICMILMTSNHN